MTLLLDDFANRRRQVRHYLAIVASAERGSSLNRLTKRQERRLVTLRAGTFLLVYNLVEATAREMVTFIHDRISAEKVPFGNLSAPLRLEAVRRFKKHKMEVAPRAWLDLPCEFVEVAFGVEVRFSGNVDARHLREIADSYGFSHATDKSLTWDGADLVTIKDARNDLAHGLRSFEEVGRDYPYNTLLGISRRSMLYMQSLVVNVSDYISGAHYRIP